MEQHYYPQKMGWVGIKKLICPRPSSCDQIGMASPKAKGPLVRSDHLQIHLADPSIGLAKTNNLKQEGYFCHLESSVKYPPHY